MQEAMVRESNVRKATDAQADEQARCLAEDVKTSAMEQMTRSMNQKKADNACTEEQSRRVDEDNTEAKANCRRRSITIMDELVKTAADSDSDKVYVIADE